MIREIQLEDLKAYRYLRLEALKDSPYAFGSTLEEESKMDQDRWEQRVSEYCNNSYTYFLLCFEEDTLVGMAGCSQNQNKKKRSHIYSVWLHPNHRKKGYAKQMLKLLEAWSIKNGMHSIEGYVTENNTMARTFYKKVGFIETDEQIALRWNPQVSEILIEKYL